jgi:hypothetical protein
MLKMTVRLENKAGETVGQFNLELPAGVTKPGIDLAAVAAAEAFVQGQGKPMEYAKELTIEVEVTHDAADGMLAMLQAILEHATVISAPAASEKTN